MVAAETKLFMRASAAVFQNVSLSGSRWDWRFGEYLQKKSLPVVAAEKGIFRTASMKNAKNNSAQVGQNFQNQLPDNLSGIKNDFRPSWLEVQNSTSAQVGQKLKNHFYATCKEVKKQL